MKNIERRFITSKNVEMRAVDGINVLDCLAIPYGTFSEDLGGFFETIKAGAFSRSLVQNPDVRMLWNHNADEPIGRAGVNMILTDGGDGVHCNTKLPKTTLANDIAELVRTGIVTGMSFGFVCNTEEWSEQPDGSILRTIVDADLFEVSPVTFPAYGDSAVSIRSNDNNKSAIESLKQFRTAKQSSLEAHYQTLERQIRLATIQN